MDLRQLRALVTVGETGNVTRASVLLNLVQPAVSRQLKLLEQDVGTPLFERGRHGMALTPAGRTLAGYARRILDELARARAELQPSSGDVGGLVNVGLLASTAELLTGPLVRAVAAAYPAIRLRVTVGYSGYLRRWLESGELDAAVLYDVRPGAALQITRLLSDALWVVAPASAGLRAGRPVTMKQFARHPVVLPSAAQGLRTMIEQAASTAGVALDVAVETNDVGAQKRLVAEGMGYTVLPGVAVAADLAHGRLCAAPLTRPGVARKVVLATPTARPPAAAVRCVMAALVACMRQAVDDGRWPAASWLPDGSLGRSASAS